MVRRLENITKNERRVLQPEKRKASRDIIAIFS